MTEFPYLTYRFFNLYYLTDTHLNQNSSKKAGIFIMESKQIEYILKIAEKNNITKAANELFISQPALNQQLIRLEKELGIPLFHRSRSNWHLTEAGEIYVEAAKKILQMKNNAYRQIHDLTEGKYGHLSVGFTAGRGIAMFTQSYSRFHQLYPNIIVEYKEGIVQKLHHLIAQDTLDIGFLTLTKQDQNPENIYQTIYEEELFLAVPSGHPIARRASAGDGQFPVLDIHDLQYEPFILMDKYSTMRTMVDQIFADGGFSPNILFETGNNLAVISMVQASLGCGILAWYYVKERPEGITFFCLPGHPTWEFVACHKKDHYLNNAANVYIDLAKKLWGKQSTSASC